MRKSVILLVIYITCVLLLLGVSILMITLIRSIADLAAVLMFNLLIFYLVSWGFYDVITDQYNEELKNERK